VFPPAILALLLNQPGAISATTQNINLTRPKKRPPSTKAGLFVLGNVVILSPISALASSFAGLVMIDNRGFINIARWRANQSWLMGKM